ncbi:glycosyltransferase family A protein [Cellulomonas gilvus]|uniref:Glycosyl transferase n=1 Tax=Cellulomonas gilvus (strain ATCC 13127 / NRRL B-14078) TaxID=593907 RepID=F8A181_CELGA|nr:glycosyltransferase family A protein [Cellulomonas gilvus]AEI11628.1 glycosyl transferase [Cellulomonas gilvus ATCC 13127]
MVNARLRRVAERLRPNPASGPAPVATPADPGPATPAVRPAPACASVRAWVVAGDRTATGLAGQWTQERVSADVPAGDLPQVVVVELVDGRPAGWTGDDEAFAAFVAHVVSGGVPVLVWATSGGPGAAAWLDVASQVLVADESQVASWAPRAVQVLPLAAAWSARAGGPRGERALVVAPAGLVGRKDLAPVATDRAEPGATAAQTLTRYAAVVLDATAPDAAHLILDAAGAGVTPYCVGPLPAGLPPTVAARVVVVEQDVRDARHSVRARAAQPELRDRDAVLLRRASAGHGFDDRALALASAAGLDLPHRGRTVSAVVPTNRPDQLEHVLVQLAAQRDVDVELVLVLHGITGRTAELEGRARELGLRLVVVEAPAEATLGRCMNLGVDAASGDLVAKMDDDNHYGPHYLADLAQALRSSGAGLAGKWAHYVWLRSTDAVVLRYPDHENTFGTRVQGGSMLFEGDVVRDLRFGDHLPRAVDTDILDRAAAAGVPIFSADRFGYVSVRGTDRMGHTWTVTDETFLTAAGRLEFFGDPRTHVDV